MKRNTNRDVPGESIGDDFFNFIFRRRFSKNGFCFRNPFGNPRNCGNHNSFEHDTVTAAVQERCRGIVAGGAREEEDDDDDDLILGFISLCSRTRFAFI